mmetsp:Transcript_162432/g.520583  ORF Transcript_162432/g.520583 Transcript_162432/m.520583 type:complete len:308 (+) Transcript_162432:391-1314(+)
MTGMQAQASLSKMASNSPSVECQTQHDFLEQQSIFHRCSMSMTMHVLISSVVSLNFGYAKVNSLTGAAAVIGDAIAHSPIGRWAPCPASRWGRRVMGRTPLGDTRCPCVDILAWLLSFATAPNTSDLASRASSSFWRTALSPSAQGRLTRPSATTSQPTLRRARRSWGRTLIKALCTERMSSRPLGSETMQASYTFKQSLRNFLSPFPGAAVVSSGVCPGSSRATTKRASSPKEKTSADVEGLGLLDMLDISSGAVQCLLPPSGRAFTVSIRDRPKSSTFALGLLAVPSTRILEGFTSPCTMGGRNP